MLNILLSEIFDVLKKRNGRLQRKSCHDHIKTREKFSNSNDKKNPIETPLQFILNFDESLQ